MTELRLIKTTGCIGFRREQYVSADFDVCEYRMPPAYHTTHRDAWYVEDRRGIAVNIDDDYLRKLTVARSTALTECHGWWCAYQDGGAGKMIAAGLECIVSDLVPVIAEYLLAITPFSLPSPADDVHLCVAREFDFTHMTTDWTAEAITKCRRSLDRWYDNTKYETWKIVGRNDVTFEYGCCGWCVTDIDTMYMTKCSNLHSILLSSRRSQILRAMWADVDLPDKSEAEYEAFRRSFGL